jgi:phosphopantetheinyl transferase
MENALIGEINPFFPTSVAASVFILEHESELEAAWLEGLCPWPAAELARMRRFVQTAARTSYCLARLLTRTLVSAATGLARDDIVFSEAEKGKPYVAGNPLRFNWSHAAGCVAVAISRQGEIGIDLEERGRSLADELEIARRFFSREEAAWIEAGGESGRGERFVSIFVQKEAFLKMTGEGLSGSLKEAKAFLSLPQLSGESSLLCYAGKDRDYITAVRLAGRGRFDIRSARLDPASGLPGLTDFAPHESTSSSLC